MLNNTLFNKNNKNEFLQNLWGKLVSESENYRDISKQNRVHTIIEFIFKKTASEFIEIANERNIFFNKIFILSGTILESRRREIINKLKSDEFKQTNILLITTQVVEAGVDIDMDLGFKDSSLLDSDEQLAGRINRNVKKIKCKLFLFDYDNARIIYGNDYRFRLAKEKLKLEEYRAILQNKKFDELYGLVMEHIAEFNKQEGYTDNLPAYLKLIKNLDFKSVNNEFQLISNSFPTISIFIPVEIPIKISNSCSEKNFTVIELSFLKEKECYSDEEFVSGENVWNLYCDIIENNDSDFTKKKINQVIMLGLISKFTISVGTYSKEFMAITGFGVGEEKYGFYKLNYHDEIYDYETGIIVKELDSAIIF
jgi:CRISPR-associated endonuclease/helicase Cas3